MNFEGLKQWMTVWGRVQNLAFSILFLTIFLAFSQPHLFPQDTIVVNDRWGSDTLCKHGGYFTCADRYNPGKLQSRKWENALSLDLSSWGFRRNAQLQDYFNITQLIQV